MSVLFWWPAIHSCLGTALILAARKGVRLSRKKGSFVCLCVGVSDRAIWTEQVTTFAQ